MANLFEQFHSDFPTTFADLPIKEKKKKKKNVFETIADKAKEEFSFGTLV